MYASETIMNVYKVLKAVKNDVDIKWQSINILSKNKRQLCTVLFHVKYIYALKILEVYNLKML